MKNPEGLLPAIVAIIAAVILVLGIRDAILRSMRNAPPPNAIDSAAMRKKQKQRMQDIQKRQKHLMRDQRQKIRDLKRL